VQTGIIFLNPNSNGYYTMEWARVWGRF